MCHHVTDYCHTSTPLPYIYLHICREEINVEELQHSHGRKPMPVRVAGVIAAAKAFDGDKVNWTLAQSIFEDMGGGLPARAVGSYIPYVLQRWWTAFITTGSVYDAHRSGRPTLVPDDLAAEAAELVKKGTWVKRVVGRQEFDVQVLYRTIPSAVNADARLRAICEQCGVTSEQLRNAMERVDPNLVRHTLHFKYAHSAEQMQGRRSFCQQMLEAVSDIPAARTATLDRFLWWDEGGVSLSAVENRPVCVWAERGALQSYDVLRWHGVSGGRECKIHFGIGVSSHPAFIRSNGLVYFEFTTGTTAIKRLHNVFAADRGDEHVYQVRLYLLPDQVAKCITPHLAVHAYCL